MNKAQPTKLEMLKRIEMRAKTKIKRVTMKISITLKMRKKENIVM